MIEDTTKASEVHVATYMYDHQKVHECFLKRLRYRKSRPFTLHVYIDRRQLKIGTVPKKMRVRMQELKQAGAHVYLCKGRGLDIYHAKGLVIDRRYLYCGSANITGASKDNEELPLRCTGDIVGQILGRLALTRAKWPLWDGNMSSL